MPDVPKEPLVHWVTRCFPNFGERIAPYLFEQLSGKQARYVDVGCRRPHFVTVGSFLREVSPQATVWGTGFIDSGDTLGCAPRFCAVRGPLSREKVLKAGVECPDVCFDPVLILPTLVPPVEVPAERRKPFGFMCHFREKPLDLFPGVDRLDVYSPDLIEEVQRYSVVAASTLHGLILAHAYGVPAVWVRPTDVPVGDGFKQRDYLASVDVDQPVLRPRNKKELYDCERYAVAPAFDARPLLDCCPFATDA